jgi:hypothetical protein
VSADRHELGAVHTCVLVECIVLVKAPDMAVIHSSWTPAKDTGPGLSADTASAAEIE